MPGRLCTCAFGAVFKSSGLSRLHPSRIPAAAALASRLTLAVACAVFSFSSCEFCGLVQPANAARSKIVGTCRYLRRSILISLSAVLDDISALFGWPFLCEIRLGSKKLSALRGQDCPCHSKIVPGPNYERF